jgi:leishmanolysin-like peptidase
MDTWISGSIVVKIHIYVKLVILFILLVCQPDSFLADDISFTKDQFHCSHKPPSENEVIYDVHLDDGDSGHIQKRSVFQNLRIHLHYDYSVSQLPTSHERLVKKMVTEAVLYWENTLMVRPAVLPVRLNRQCSSIDVRYKDKTRFCVDGCSKSTTCGDILIPEQHLER